MSEDGHIDYSEFSLNELKEASSIIDKTRYPVNYANLVAAIKEKELDELEEPKQLTPRVDIHSANHSPPEISTFTFGPRCPACGWRKPLFMAGTGFGKSFKCPDCGSHLNLTKIHRRLNAALWTLFVPLFAWFSFSGLESSKKLTIIAVLIFLAFLEFWFTRLELIEPKGD
jgi:hypothetical protein